MDQNQKANRERYAEEMLASYVAGFDAAVEILVGLQKENTLDKLKKKLKDQLSVTEGQ